MRESQSVSTMLDLTMLFDDHEALIPFVVQVSPFIVEEGWLQLASEWLQRASVAARDHQQLATLAWLLNVYAGVLFRLADIPGTLKTYAEALQLARSIPDQNELACQILTSLAWMHHMYGYYEQAEYYLQQAWELATGLQLSPEHLAKLYRVHGAQAWQRGDYAQAQTAFEDGLRLMWNLPETQREEICMFPTFLASIEGYRGHYEQAEALFEQAVQTADRYGPKDFLIFIEGRRGLMRATHRTDRAVMLDLSNSLVLAKKLSVMGYAIFVFRALAMWELALGDPYTAEPLAEKALHFSRHFQAKNRIAEALTLLAQIALCRDDDVQAAEHLEQALPLARTCCPAEEVATTLLVMAEVALRQSNFSQADELYREVQSIAPPEHRVLTASVLYGLARLAAARGEKGEARQRGKAAFQILDELKHVQAAEVRAWLHSLRPRWLRRLPGSLSVSRPQVQETRETPENHTWNEEAGN